MTDPVTALDLCCVVGGGWTNLMETFDDTLGRLETRWVLSLTSIEWLVGSLLWVKRKKFLAQSLPLEPLLELFCAKIENWHFAVSMECDW